MLVINDKNENDLYQQLFHSTISKQYSIFQLRWQFFTHTHKAMDQSVPSSFSSSLITGTPENNKHEATENVKNMEKLKLEKNV